MKKTTIFLAALTIMAVLASNHYASAETQAASTTATNVPSVATPGTTPSPAIASSAAIKSPVTASHAGTASDAIKNFYAALEDTMRQGDQLGYAGRFKKLEPTIKSNFNLPVMTKFAVGPAWTKATPSEQDALIAAFSDFTIANYASQFKTYNGEEFNVIDEKTLAGIASATGGVMVETTLKPKDKPAVTLNYLLRPDDKGIYRIVDIFLNGSISQLAARRAEFNAIAERDGIPALVTTLGEKSKQMGPT
jgi:phospholipid transport system substrate-binding protein